MDSEHQEEYSGKMRQFLRHFHESSKNASHLRILVIFH